MDSPMFLPHVDNSATSALSIADINHNTDSKPLLNPAQNHSGSDGLKKYMERWNYEKIRNNETVVQNLRRQYHLLRDMGKHDEAEKLYKAIRKMDRCRHDFVEFNLKGNPHRKQRHPFRCGNKLCPICYSYQSYERCLQVFSKMLTVGGDMYGVYTFSPKNPSLDQLDKLLANLKTAPKKVFNSEYKKLLIFVNGSIRFVSLTYSGHNGFNTHLHVILHCSHLLTETEARNLYDLLNKRFKKYMDIDSDNAEAHLAIYANTLDNLKRTASYLTKYADHQNLSQSIAYMEVEKYEAYQDAYAHIREIEFTGCYRSKPASPKRASQGIKDFYKAIPCDNNPPAKIYEFKHLRKIHAVQ
jgi:hypothetical protein